MEYRPMARRHTLEQVADQLGVSRERIRQIEVSALKKCLRWCNRHDYKLQELLPGAEFEQESEDGMKTTSWDNW
ncbi:MAG: hypothetical protein GY703_18235 [Gammaproteobacteria bacterium]|nr:hypothetical protein [Gammaproteobacteria bacterium]